jgi:tryptophan-rich sensory protein
MNQSTWYRDLKKPSWAPSAKIFAPVWTALYVIIAWSFGLTFYCVAKGYFPLVVGLPFVLNLIFNFAFTPIEFRLRNNIAALVDVLCTLGTLIWAMVVIFPLWAPVVFVNIPYLLWLMFASALQIAVTAKNRGR